MKLSLFSLCFFYHLITFAAPIPATSTSRLTDPSYGLFFNQLGFTLKIEKTPWILSHHDADLYQEGFRFVPEDKSRKLATVSVRMDKMSSQTNFALYSKRWMRDYTNYGFDLLGYKEINFGGGPALVVDLVSRLKNRQLRQIILNSKQKIAILTCLDEQSTFSKTLPECNQIFSSFKWL
jgi:hypothetical protein